MSTKDWKIEDRDGAIAEGSGERVLVVTDEGYALVGDGDPKSGRDEIELIVKALGAVIPKIPPGSTLAAAYSAKATLEFVGASEAMAARMGIPSIADALEAAEDVAREVICQNMVDWVGGADEKMAAHFAETAARAIKAGIAERLAPKG